MLSMFTFHLQEKITKIGVTAKRPGVRKKNCKLDLCQTYSKTKISMKKI